ncbi:MAG: alcohol dehydrogenase catalytic domain-containing protein [Rhodobacteraceae bacterium]|nr:alcohol dehydrogenase catalytic domain-containing protein [Paracoccaceae bacterium]
MKAVRLRAPGAIGIEDVPVPEPGPGEVLVRVEAAGVCGTDRHLLRGEYPCTPPVTLGHEFGGIVVAAGPGAGIAEGTRVCCDPNDWCGSCAMCRSGRVNLCPRNVATGVHRDGGFADYVSFPARRAHVLPPGLDPRRGAFCEPLACTLHGMDMAALRPGERALILGGGVIGQLAARLAAAAGAEVMMLTRSTVRQDLALQGGARHAAATPAQARALWPEGADAVLECAGVAETVAASPALARTGGRVVVMGVLPGGVQVPIEPFDLLLREITLGFAFLNPFTQARAVALIAGGHVDVGPLISREVALDDLPRVIASDPAPGEIRVIARPQGTG